MVNEINYLKENKIEYCVDSTNVELTYSRNFLRAKVIPDLKDVNAGAVAHINQTAAYLSEVKDYMDQETERLWSELACVADDVSINCERLQELHPVLQKQIAYKAIVVAAEHMKDIQSSHVEDLLELCKGQSGKRIMLPYGVMARKDFSWVYLCACEKDSFSKKEDGWFREITEELLETLKADGVEWKIPLGDGAEALSCRVFENKSESSEIPRNRYTKWFDYDKIKDGFCIRTRRSGDYLISDALGHRKKLKTYFIDEKIPVPKRDGIWILTMGSLVLWVIGGRISEHVKVSQKTKYILEITYDGGMKNE